MIKKRKSPSPNNAGPFFMPVIKDKYGRTQVFPFLEKGYRPLDLSLSARIEVFDGQVRVNAAFGAMTSHHAARWIEGLKLAFSLSGSPLPEYRSCDWCNGPAWSGDEIPFCSSECKEASEEANS